MPRIIDKVSLDRLLDKELKITLLCPYCRSTRITLAPEHSTETHESIDCPKCGAHIMLDSLSVVVIKDGSAARS